MMLYIVRHAWAADRDDARYANDASRPLTERGTQRFRRVVQHLARCGWAPSRVATSPLLRCQQTAEIIADEVPQHPKITVLEALEPGSRLDEALTWTRSQAKRHDQIAWVGHAPDVSEMTAQLIGDGRAWIRFAKGAVAAIHFGGSIRPGQGILYWHATAKLLGC